jgi:hypothetical protein
MDAVECRQVEDLLAHKSFGAVAAARPCQPPARGDELNIRAFA